jgi:RNA polymerase sigma-70 factor (ECF subfamily)
MSSDRALIEECIHGNSKAQKDLYEQYSRQMMAVCMRYSKKTEDAEDILQEAFVKVFRNLDQFRYDSTLYFWIKRIVINTALNYHRGKMHQQQTVDVEEIHDLADDEVTLSNYHLKDLLNLLQSLPDGSRVVFNLYAIEGYQHREIAEKLGISEGTSKSQYARAKRLLRDMIAKLERHTYERFGER